jgi:hypothetical protein
VCDVIDWKACAGERLNYFLKVSITLLFSFSNDPLPQSFIHLYQKHTQFSDIDCVRVWHYDEIIFTILDFRAAIYRLSRKNSISPFPSHSYGNSSFSYFHFHVEKKKKNTSKRGIELAMFYKK